MHYTRTLTICLPNSCIENEVAEVLYSVTAELLPSSLTLMVYVSNTPLTSAGATQLTVKVVSFTLRTPRLPTGPDSEGMVYHMTLSVCYMRLHALYMHSPSSSYTLIVVVPVAVTRSWLSLNVTMNDARGLVVSNSSLSLTGSL